MFETAARYRTEILATLARGDALLRASEPDVAALGEVRWKLAQAIRSYQIHKHGEIFDPLIAGGDVPCVEIARGMKAMCTAAAAGGRAFIIAWSGRSVGADWPDYSAATLDMNEAIRQHLEAERRGFVELEAAIRRAPAEVSARVR